ncbi:E3 ubiquitin-protein ligase RNFT1 [Danio rerio]|uniref:E3 ubiquitin-protein ligase RNFT1 n=1 Tax=Danio rerio TaxID=7955 RepID=RNFT1_DANRE|nr:E3 ubiquitin-protein ligase RNFT1 [Danio rerio]Q6NZ21.2 RecName: Full=E3 ubiquitin-protein ligase RNFT1; AltName: Full=RING finger and transmembrane domain-containing protein 1 [Danio rerio]|eukprot:NP_998393.2 E3 ubiquitin-protein ligase RNFT1 [Danio rerio]
MKLRAQFDRGTYSESKGSFKLRDSLDPMQPEPSSREGNGLSLTLQPELLARMPGAGSSSGTETGEDVRVPMGSSSGSTNGRGATSRRMRTASHSHSHTHGHGHSHEHESDSGESDLESGESSSSISELRYLLRWLKKSLPFIVILCAKLVIQHALGLAVAVGLFTTFMYVNKSIQTQVFLHDRRTNLHCAWLLLFLTSSSLLVFYTFHTQSLYRCLFFANATIDYHNFWEVLWSVGVTNFILKFIFMGFKCLILLVPCPLMTYRRRGQWYMLIEEVGQLYQVIAPVPLWFRYLVSYDEMDTSVGLTLGILLALLYLIMKLLALYGLSGSLQKTLRTFFSPEVNGAPASPAQIREAGDICPICQADFKQPRVLVCQHIFCEECIAQWLNQERTCPLCRTVITDKVHKWKDGATSAHLQIY